MSFDQETEKKECDLQGKKNLLIIITMMMMMSINEQKKTKKKFNLEFFIKIESIFGEFWFHTSTMQS